jgi:hypothetical protein
MSKYGPWSRSVTPPTVTTTARAGAGEPTSQKVKFEDGEPDGLHDLELGGVVAEFAGGREHQERGEEGGDDDGGDEHVGSLGAGRERW